jgi:hypothetical protein
MTSRKPRQLSTTEQSRLDDALAALLASTRRAKRSLDLVALGRKLDTAIQLLGSLRAVADALGLSDETVRQFSRVHKLSPEVKKLVAAGKITGMDLADRLSRFPATDQYPIASGVVSGSLDAHDVRALLSLRKMDPRPSIQQLIRRIRKSRNIKEYVAEFIPPGSEADSSELMNRISRAIDRRDIRGVEMEDGIGRLILTVDGKSTLESAAREGGVSKREMLQYLVDGGAKRDGR